MPVVDFQIDNPDGVDRAAMAKTNANVEKAAAAMLTFRAAESKVQIREGVKKQPSS